MTLAPFRPTLAAALLIVAAEPLGAATLPSIDVGRLCAGSEVSVDGGRAEASCRRQEAAARDKLRALWAGLTPRERALCVDGAAFGVAPSYTGALGCIETAREVAREQALPGAVSTRGPSAMR